MASLIKLFSSYGLSCVLLLALFMLTILGTLYQVDNGLYAAKQTYFNSWFLMTSAGIPYFPGGVLVMVLLTINLIVGGFIRMKWHARNAGVLIIHAGIVFMLISGLVKLNHSNEGHLTLYEGQTSDEFVSYHENEVTIWEVSGGREANLWVIPDEQLTDLGGQQRKFTSDELPFSLELSGFLENCRVLPRGPNWTPSGKGADGFGFMAMNSEKESERNTPGMHAQVTLADGSQQEALLWGRQRAPWAVAVDGRTFAIHFAHSAYKMPFSIHLDKFIKEDHPGTRMAKAYKSQVTQIAPGKEKAVLIQMNEPLRDSGLILFQSSYGPSTPNHKGPFFSVFSVVRNPSDKWPEYSLWIITFGLVLTFGRHLFGFARKQNKRRARAAGEQA